MKEALPPHAACSRGSGIPASAEPAPEQRMRVPSPRTARVLFCLRGTWTLDFALLRRGPRGIFDVLSPPPDPAPGALGVRFG